jgi:tRNA-splicing ligase RtcB
MTIDSPPERKAAEKERAEQPAQGVRRARRRHAGADAQLHGVGNVVAGVICADGHLGYAQPVGGVIAYEGQISISGVGFDIGCGNMAIRLDTPVRCHQDRVGPIIKDVARSFHSASAAPMTSASSTSCSTTAKRGRNPTARTIAEGRCAARHGRLGNHYVDLMRDEEGFVWIGVHFGSRGLGHSSATKYLKAAGGKDGMNVPPAVIDEDSEIGRATSPRWSLPAATPTRAANGCRARAQDHRRQRHRQVHNHHNYAWRERHGDRDLWVVRKGATPAFPGQRGFRRRLDGRRRRDHRRRGQRGGAASLYSTVHGAGRLFGRKEAKRRFTRAEMDASGCSERGVILVGATSTKARWPTAGCPTCWRTTAIP